MMAGDGPVIKAEAAGPANGAPPLPLPMDLPLLSEKQDRIVHFAKIYQRNNDEDVYESLLDLSEELAGIASLQAEQRERRASEGKQERLTYATDQLTLLTTSSETGGGLAGDTAANKTALAKQQLLQASRARESKGKPMRRFQGSSISPFEHALTHNGAPQTRRDDDSQLDDAMYVKVQQTAWEDDIIWGFDIGAKSKQGNNDVAAVEEKEDEDGQSGLADASRANGHSAPFARNVSTEATSRGANSRPDQSTASSSSEGYKTMSYKEMYPRRKMPAQDTPWIPSYTEPEFDMTKPRHYRWEIPENDNSTSKASTNSKPLHEQKKADQVALGKLPCPLNKELDDGSWVGAIGWNSTQDMPESKLILDDNDASLILTVPDMDDVRPTLRIPERKLGAAEIKLEQLDKQRREKKQRIDAVMGNLEFGDETAEGRLGTEGGGKKNKDSRVVKNIGYVHHSLPAIKLSMTKPELPKAKLREFHRPRSKFKINERMVFAPPPVVPIPPVEEGAVVTQIKKSSDLNLTAGGKIILVEYTEQNPPMLSNPGMASRILHYWRPPDNEEDVLVGKKKVKKAKPKAPEMKMGQVITLGHHDETPFVGDVPPGRVVTSLNSKLYKVPIFQHKPVAPFAPSTSVRESGQYELFLLCRSASKGKKGAAIGESAKTTMYAFEMPDLYLAGQIEPQIEVPAPNSRSANDFIRPYMSFHILKLFKKASDGERLKIEDIARAFPNQSGTAIRKRMKEVATFERGGNDSGWWKIKPASQLTSEEEIRASINPESVCLYESMMAGHRRLLDIGLTKLFTPTGVNGAINLLLKRLELRKQALSLALVEPLKLERRAKEKAEQDVWKRDPTVRKLETDIQVARYIHEQLQLTPWNLTNNYVECHLQGKGSGMLLLGGIGDPTGRGEGFSFVRVPQSRAKKKEGEEEAAAGPNADAAAVQKAVAAVTGTTADLRKLKMKEAGDVLRNLGVAEADIKKLRRWDRIHMVRELSSLATAHGRAGALSKFARGARKSLSAQQQDYRRKCDVIYERQMNVLSSTTVSFSDDEESGDDSDIIDELEDELLGAGSFGKDDREKIVKLGPKNLFTKGGGGLNRSKEALAEREDAVELERLMKEMKEDSGATSASRRADVDASKLRTQLRASGIADGGSGSAASSVAGAQGGTRPGSSMGMSRGGSNMASAINTPIEHRSRASSPTSASKWPSSGETPSRVPGRKVLKRTTRVVEEDGTETVRIEFIVDDRQVARFQAKQHRQDRLQKSDERNLLRKRKRMLALEDDAPGSSLLDVAKRRKQLQEELKQLQRTEEQNKDYVEMLEREGEAGLGSSGASQKGGGVRCTQCGQVGHMRTNRSCPLYMADGGGGVTGEAIGSGSVKKVRKGGSEEVEKITVNLAELREGARKHEAEKKRKRIQEQKEQAELYKRPYMNAVVKQSRSRMPVSHLNGNLGVVIEKLMDMPESELFRFPVDANTVKDYYQIIKQPMDLSAIKKKIDDMQYDSMRDFIKDLELIVNNSKIYNGDPARSLITANAVKIQKRAQEELATLNAEGGTPTAGERN